jgi:predicted phosphate transport protein (TIGR00153 family)
VRLIPRDEQFFSMFSQLARLLCQSADLLSKLFAEPQRMAELVTAIKTLEHEADNLTHDVMIRIDKSFVTPIDREDIHLLASRLDDVIDLLDGTARRAQMFHIVETREPAKRLADVLSRAANCIEGAVADMKKPKVVAQRSAEMKALEEEGDAIYHEAVGNLFAGSPDPLEVIKWKELYDKLEDAIDQCDDVTNVIESIALKNG